MAHGTVVIGLGNTFMRDDGIGIKVVQELKKRILNDDVMIQEYEEMDLSLLEELKEASKLIIIDSMRSGKSPGTVSKFSVVDETNLPLELPSLHSLELYHILKLAKRIGLLICPVLIVGIEPLEISLGENLSQELKSALPSVVQTVLTEL